MVFLPLPSHGSCSVACMQRCAWVALSRCFLQLYMKSNICCCRAPEDAKDEVASGLHGNLIAQRLKLNGRVALVTGAFSRCADE